MQVSGIVQRQAGVVGVLQSVLKLHLHRQAPAGAANHIRLLSVGKNSRRSLPSKDVSERRGHLSGPRSCDVHMSL